jgi:predicted N-acyltransferase
MDREIHSTIRDIHEREWTSLVGTGNLESSHQWYRTVEDSGMKDMYYVTVRDSGKLAAAACCYLFDENILRIPTLDVSSPLGLSTAFFAETPEETYMLLKGLEEIQRREKAKGISFFELKKEEFESLKPYLKGSTGYSMLDNTYLDVVFTDFDEYLASLNRKSRRSIKDTLIRGDRLGVTVSSTKEFSKWKDIAYKLQKALCDTLNDYTLLLSKQFYDALEKNMKDCAELLIFFKDDTPIVFSLVLYTPETAHYKFVGLNPDYREYQAYFLTYYEIIRKAIERKQKRVYFGTTTYEFKEKIGCQRQKLFGLTVMKNAVYNVGFKTYVKMKAFKS